MFGRKPPSGSGESSQAADRGAAPAQPATPRLGVPTGPQRFSVDGEALPPRPTAVQPMGSRGGPIGGEGQPPRRPAEPARDVRKLVIGREITLAGEIAACDHLIVEGTVEAGVKECHRLEVAESGLFRGTVEIGEAEIAGRFEGEIIVQGRLSVRSTGRLDGKIQYSELLVEAGGRLDGEIRSNNKPAPKPAPKPIAAPPPAAEPSAATAEHASVDELKL